MAKKEKINVRALSPEDKKYYKGYKRELDRSKAEKALDELQKKISQSRFQKTGVGKVSKGFFKGVDTFAKKSPSFKKGNLRVPAIPPSREQQFFQTLMGGRKTFGTGQNLPKINNSLTSGFGLTKNGDNGETIRMFGGM